VGRTPSVPSSLVLLLGILAGCATATVEQQLGEARQSWEGATYDEVVARWGPPARSAKLAEGAETHTWVSQETPVRAYGPAVGVGVFGGSGGGGGVGVGIGFPFGATVNPAACERAMTFKDGRLAEQHWTGDPAFCRYFKRG
jgi:hypothetical protein